MSATTAATEQRAVLEAFDRAVGRELHNLERPGRTWQQVHNRLQWEVADTRATCANQPRVMGKAQAVMVADDRALTE